MKNINAKVIIKYLDFPRDFSFQLDENLLLEFDKFENNIATLHINGNCNDELTESYIQSLLNKFLDLLNFEKEGYWIEDFQISDYHENKDVSVPHKASSTRGIVMTAKGVITEDIKNTLSDRQLNSYSQEHLLCLNFYRKACLIKDSYAKFWYFYTIASILLDKGKNHARKDINDYFMDKWPDNTQFSDYNNEEDISKFVFMRDLFSHIDKTSNGRKVDQNSFLNENISDFTEEIKEVMKNNIPDL